MRRDTMIDARWPTMVIGPDQRLAWPRGPDRSLMQSWGHILNLGGRCTCATLIARARGGWAKGVDGKGKREKDKERRETKETTQKQFFLVIVACQFFYDCYYSSSIFLKRYSSLSIFLMLLYHVIFFLFFNEVL